ncbi:histone acetyltransferase subunit NuA4-domain-containing protein [Mrakia frigida]|uniref:Eaf6p n=1 Tax=Mrakia frigida TaxID=29902 RepID=UPI003FCC250C
MSSPAAEGKAANEAAKMALQAALIKKRAVDKQLASIEGKIYAFEGSYLEESSNTGGNIVKGFDGYLKAPPTGGAHKKRYEVTDADRLFSGSSLTYGKSLELKMAAEGR